MCNAPRLSLITAPVPGRVREIGEGLLAELCDTVLGKPHFSPADNIDTHDASAYLRFGKEITRELNGDHSQV